MPLLGECRQTRKLPTVNSFLCCIPLKFGGFFLGVVDIILCILFVYKDAVALIPGQASNSTQTLISPVEALNSTTNQYAEEKGGYIISPNCFIAIGIAFNCIGILASIFWFKGIHTEKPTLMFPTVIVSFLRFFYIIISVTHSSGILPALGFRPSIYEYFEAIVAFYFYIVEYSLYEKMKSAEKEKNDAGINERAATLKVNK